MTHTQNFGLPTRAFMTLSDTKTSTLAVSPCTDIGGPDVVVVH